jgi:uncharacterized protein YdeI (YjbR/CyaY-like superfamily)
MAGGEQPVLAFESAAHFAAWLEEHGAESDGIWLEFAKKGTGVSSVTYPEAVEAALCHGWIDGQARRIDDVHYRQRFTPRRARSRWSKINREKAERLMREGRMRPRGFREVERAKADGRWEEAYDSPRSATTPEDFERALKKEPKARAFYESLGPSKRYSFLYRIREAKRPETRARRIAEYVALLADGKTLH